MAHHSPIDDEVRISGLSSETAAEIVSLIRAEIKASELHSRPPEAASGQKFAASVQIWAAACTTIAALAFLAGITQLQLIGFRNEMRATTESILAEIRSIREEIGSD